MTNGTCTENYPFYVLSVYVLSYKYILSIPSSPLSNFCTISILHHYILRHVLSTHFYVLLFFRMKIQFIFKPKYYDPLVFSCSIFIELRIVSFVYSITKEFSVLSPKTRLVQFLQQPRTQSYSKVISPLYL